MGAPDGFETIRETLFGTCIGRRILDITTGELGAEHWDKVYFHLDDGQTFFATIGSELNPGLLGFIDMDDDDDGEDSGGEQAA
jgi:hypothetical protein